MFDKCTHTACHHIGRCTTLPAWAWAALRHNLYSWDKGNKCELYIADHFQTNRLLNRRPVFPDIEERGSCGYIYIYNGNTLDVVYLYQEIYIQSREFWLYTSKISHWIIYLRPKNSWDSPFKGVTELQIRMFGISSFHAMNQIVSLGANYKSTHLNKFVTVMS